MIFRVRRTSGGSLDGLDTFKIPGKKDADFIELEDLDALMNVIDEHGQCVLYVDGGCTVLEIYDDYRE